MCHVYSPTGYSKRKTVCMHICQKTMEMFYLTTHSTYFIYGYMASDIWLRTILRKETRCRHIGYSFRLTPRIILYAPFHRQDNTYHEPCYTSRGALAGTRNSSMPEKRSPFRSTAFSGQKSNFTSGRDQMSGYYI